MGDADPLLVHGVAWASATPQLEVSSFTDDAPHPIPLLGRRLAFSVDPARYCLGFREHTDAGSRHRLCDGSRLATTGHQCERCAARDTSRFMHHAHRGGYVPDTMNAALAQPHWLYIATFADGTSKVGTATDARKRIRLDEQGAVRATYLTRAADGYAVRHLEDAVTAEAGIAQTKHKSAKLAALAQALPLDEVARHHTETVRSAADVIAPTLCLSADAVLQDAEAWQPPEQHEAFFAGGRLHPIYPHALDVGDHALTPAALIGSVALVVVNDDDPADDGARVLIDLAALTGHRLTLGDVRSPEAAAQHGLF